MAEREFQDVPVDHGPLQEGDVLLAARRNVNGIWVTGRVNVDDILERIGKLERRRGARQADRIDILAGRQCRRKSDALRAYRVLCQRRTPLKCQRYPMASDASLVYGKPASEPDFTFVYYYPKGHPRSHASLSAAGDRFVIDPPVIKEGVTLKLHYHSRSLSRPHRNSRRIHQANRRGWLNHSPTSEKAPCTE